MISHITRTHTIVLAFSLPLKLVDLGLFWYLMLDFSACIKAFYFLHADKTVDLSCDL
jgi:hypothetical protein